MKHTKVYTEGKHALEQAKKFAPHAVLKVFEDARGNEVAQISVHRLTHEFDAWIETLMPTPDTVLVFLCGVEDPHNSGAIIRSAAAFGASGVLMPQRGASPVTGAVLKVSAGMAFRIPLVIMQDILKAISTLKKKGFRVYGLSGGEGSSVAQEPFEGPSVLVLGNEGSGIPAPTRAVCDALLSVPMHPKAESLNVAAAATTTLYAWSLRHPKALE